MRYLLLASLLLTTFFAKAQVRFSLSTDVMVLRNLASNEGFFALGQAIKTQFHVSPRITYYGSLTYSLPSKIETEFTATPRPPAAGPDIKFPVTGEYRFTTVSLGLKYYFSGSFSDETRTNIYGLVGGGWITTRIENTVTDDAPDVDNYIYLSPAIGGNSDGEFAIELGGGAEFAMGGNFFLYSELRYWRQLSSPESFYRHGNSTPSQVMVAGGLRVLFGL